MKNWTVAFNENDEYTGYLRVKANNIKQTNDTTFVADGVEIEIDEMIYSITVND